MSTIQTTNESEPSTGLSQGGPHDGADNGLRNGGTRGLTLGDSGAIDSKNPSSVIKSEEFVSNDGRHGTGPSVTMDDEDDDIVPLGKRRASIAQATGAAKRRKERASAVGSSSAPPVSAAGSSSAGSYSDKCPICQEHADDTGHGAFVVPPCGHGLHQGCLVELGGIADTSDQVCCSLCGNHKKTAFHAFAKSHGCRIPNKTAEEKKAEDARLEAMHSEADEGDDEEDEEETEEANRVNELLNAPVVEEVAAAAVASEVRLEMLSSEVGLATLAKRLLQDRWLFDGTEWYQFNAERVLWVRAEGAAGAAAAATAAASSAKRPPPAVLMADLSRSVVTRLQEIRMRANHHKRVLQQAVKSLEKPGTKTRLVPYLMAWLCRRDTLDRRDHLFPTRGGTVFDFRTRSTRPRRADDYFTWESKARCLEGVRWEQLPANASNSAWMAYWRRRSPRLMQILENTFGTSNVDTIRDFRASGGYLITGDMGGKSIVLYYGPSDASKSTWVKVFQKLVPSPGGQSLPRRVLVEEDEKKKTTRFRSDQHLFPLLRRPRLATVSEVNANSMLRGEVVRPLASGDEYAMWFSSTSTHAVTFTTKVLLDSNFQVHLPANDHGTLNRLFVVCFPFEFKSKETFNPRDSAHKLRDDSIEQLLLTESYLDEVFAFFADAACEWYEAGCPRLEMSASGKEFRDRYAVVLVPAASASIAGRSVARRSSAAPGRSAAGAGRRRVGGVLCGRGEHSCNAAAVNVLAAHALKPVVPMAAPAAAAATVHEPTAEDVRALIDPFVGHLLQQPRVHSQDSDWEHTTQKHLDQAFAEFACKRGLVMPSVKPPDNAGPWGVMRKAFWAVSRFRDHTHSPTKRSGKVVLLPKAECLRRHSSLRVGSNAMTTTPRDAEDRAPVPPRTSVAQIPAQYVRDKGDEDVAILETARPAQPSPMQAFDRRSAAATMTMSPSLGPQSPWMLQMHGMPIMAQPTIGYRMNDMMPYCYAPGGGAAFAAAHRPQFPHVYQGNAIPMQPQPLHYTQQPFLAYAPPNGLAPAPAVSAGPLASADAAAGEAAVAAAQADAQA